MEKFKPYLCLFITPAHAVPACTKGSCQKHRTPKAQRLFPTPAGRRQKGHGFTQIYGYYDEKMGENPACAGSCGTLVLDKTKWEPATGGGMPW